MNINILHYSLFGIAGGQEVDRSFSLIYYLPFYNACIMKCLYYNIAVLRNGCLL